MSGKGIDHCSGLWSMFFLILLCFLTDGSTHRVSACHALAAVRASTTAAPASSTPCVVRLRVLEDVLSSSNL
jgi:hypothetical protein